MKLPAIKLPFTPKTLNIIVLIFGVLVLAAVLYYSCANREGFDGSIPTASQTSAIPSDTPGAVTGNPTIAKPQTKDIQATLDELDTFFLLATTFDYKQSKLPIAIKHAIGMYRRMMEPIQKDLKATLATPEKSEVTLKDITELRAKLGELSKTIRSHSQNAQANPEQAAPSQPAAKLGSEEETLLQSLIQQFMEHMSRVDMNKLKQNVTDTDTQMKIVYYSLISTDYEKDLKSHSMSAEEGAYLKKTYQELTAVLKYVAAAHPVDQAQAQAQAQPQAQQNLQPERPSYESTVVAGTPGVITLKELQNMANRIDEEHLRLANLRSTSGTLQARQTQLEKLSADVRGLIGAVERKEMKLEDVPISPSTAEAFLKQMADNKSLPPLIEPRAQIANGLQAHVSPAHAPGMDVKALYSLLDSAKYLKWNLEVKLEYDPKLAMRDNLVKRLEAVERRLSALAVSETPISKDMYEVFMKELQTINAMIVPERHDSKKKNTDVSITERPETAYTRSATEAEYPTASQMTTATSIRDSASGNAILNPSKEVSPDVFIRPGFVMNDDTIKRRGSASAFDDSLVGGADYKKRSQELCRQVRGANLGEPVQFGCISNPDEVGPDYSWKGNFTMVCNRLGDTWGGWYPEMFGCPKYDPTQKFKATMM
jgi:hypothetical protein